MAVQLQRVLISDSVDASCRSILEDGGVAVDYRPGLSKKELLACVKVAAERLSSRLFKRVRCSCAGLRRLAGPLWD